MNGTGDFGVMVYDIEELDRGGKRRRSAVFPTAVLLMRRMGVWVLDRQGT